MENGTKSTDGGRHERIRSRYRYEGHKMKEVSFFKTIWSKCLGCDERRTWPWTVAYKCDKCNVLCHRRCFKKIGRSCSIYVIQTGSGPYTTSSGKLVVSCMKKKKDANQSTSNAAVDRKMFDNKSDKATDATGSKEIKADEVIRPTVGWKSPLAVIIESDISVNFSRTSQEDTWYFQDVLEEPGDEFAECERLDTGSAGAAKNTTDVRPRRNEDSADASNRDRPTTLESSSDGSSTDAVRPPLSVSGESVPETLKTIVQDSLAIGIRIPEDETTEDRERDTAEDVTRTPSAENNAKNVDSDSRDSVTSIRSSVVEPAEFANRLRGLEMEVYNSCEMLWEDTPMFRRIARLIRDDNARREREAVVDDEQLRSAASSENEPDKTTGRASSPDVSCEDWTSTWPAFSEDMFTVCEWPRRKFSSVLRCGGSCEKLYPLDDTPESRRVARETRTYFSEYRGFHVNVEFTDPPFHGFSDDDDDDDGRAETLRDHCSPDQRMLCPGVGTPDVGVTSDSRQEVTGGTAVERWQRPDDSVNEFDPRRVNSAVVLAERPRLTFTGLLQPRRPVDSVNAYSLFLRAADQRSLQDCAIIPRRNDHLLSLLAHRPPLPTMVPHTRADSLLMAGSRPEKPSSSDATERTGSSSAAPRVQLVDVKDWSLSNKVRAPPKLADDKKMLVRVRTVQNAKNKPKNFDDR